VLYFQSLMPTAKEIFDRLNLADECTNIEAKRGSAIDASIMETVNSFSNEPGLSGGWLLLGVERDESTGKYVVTGITNPDQLQLDLSTRSANDFSVTIRPVIEVEQLEGKIVMKVFVPELPAGQKPAFLKNEGLPQGALRRIGPSDQRCTQDDMHLFYSDQKSFDSTPIPGTTISDIDADALDYYRQLRRKVSEFAEELEYNDQDLLKSLGCMVESNGTMCLTYAGLLVFGTRKTQRRVLPVTRIDYLRVPGNEWVADPDKRFITIDMQGPLILLLGRLFSAVSDDLPRGFLLTEGQIQAASLGLPGKVLREALVNAIMHRSYREERPIQIIRYNNRIEIINPGFSLKPIERLAEPGSQLRNPSVAAIFHDTNLAETKGSGFRTMQRLMMKVEMAPPTFESDHTRNQFTLRLLLHHFLGEEDINWLQKFNGLGLNENQKKGLIFCREVGAIDNQSFRQINDCDSGQASIELRMMKDLSLLNPKGKGRTVYYVPGPGLSAPGGTLSALGATVSAPGVALSAPAPTGTAITTTATNKTITTTITGKSKVDGNLSTTETKKEQIPEEIVIEIQKLGQRISDKEKVKKVIMLLCTWKNMSLQELAKALDKQSKYILRKFIQPMIEDGQLFYTIPEMKSHPNQAYTTKKKSDTTIK
jgi:ATP-dependent DNA helicase RecG